MEKHPIDRLFQEKLENFIPMPSPHLWERVQATLPEKGPRKSYWKWWTLSVLVVLVGSFCVWKIAFEYSTQKVEKVPLEALVSKNLENNSRKILEKTFENQKIDHQENLISKRAVREGFFEYKNRKTEKNDTLLATPQPKQASYVQKVNDKTTMPAETLEIMPKEDATEKEKVIITTPNAPKDSVGQPKKGTKIIIKLSEPLPQESKARDFASTKTGKFLQKVRKIKEGEFSSSINF